MCKDPALRACLGQGIWRPTIREVEQVHLPSLHQPNLDVDTTVGWPHMWSNQLIDDLAALCGLWPDLSGPENEYLSPIRCLNNIIHGEITTEKIGPLLAFLGNLSLEFMDTLQRLDPKAFVIFLFWQLVLLRTGQWWIIQTGTGSCRRAIVFLWQCGGPEVKRLLLFPASMCGLELGKLR